LGNAKVVILSLLQKEIFKKQTHGLPLNKRDEKSTPAGGVRRVSLSKGIGTPFAKSIAEGGIGGELKSRAQPREANRRRIVKRSKRRKKVKGRKTT